MYSLIKIMKGEYKAWTIYFVIECIIWISVEKDKEWAYKN